MVSQVCELGGDSSGTYTHTYIYKSVQREREREQATSRKQKVCEIVLEKRGKVRKAQAVARDGTVEGQGEST